MHSGLLQSDLQQVSLLQAKIAVTKMIHMTVFSVLKYFVAGLLRYSTKYKIN